MWWYYFAHFIFHLVRWFPKNNRFKIRIVLLIFACAFLLPQFFVLTRDHSTRYCGQHLFELLIVGIIFTFCMIGFSFLFSLMDPVPWEVKIAFHVFGVISFVFGFAYVVLTANAESCSVYSAELYYLSLAIMVVCVLSMVFVAVMLPFWIINYVFRDSMLNKRERTGFCYEPVKCCSCVWHI
ncbi:uncharacterized protein LOC144349993 [Saccoglossus kowalevskii]